MRPIVILGGGLTGLVTAERMGRADVPAVVLESESEAGGACRSRGQDGYIFDLTGHLLHASTPVLETYLREVDVWEQLVVHERRSAVVIGGHSTPYPVQINTHGLSPEVRRDCLLGFIRSWAAGSARRPTTFADWILERFGDGLARHFFFPYNCKLFRTEPEELTLDWVGRFVPAPTLEEVVDGALGLHTAPVGYNAVFRYPRAGGIRLLPDAVAARLPRLELGRRVTAVHLGERWLELADGERRRYERLVATLALPHLLDLLVGEVPNDIARARARLRWTRVVNLVFGVRGRAPRDEHWLYFPDPELPYYRVGFPSNHGRLAPENCHTVSVEVSLGADACDLDAVAGDAERALVAAGLLDVGRVETRLVTVIDPAYVVFDRHRRRAVAAARRHLEANGVVLAGRWAEWKYSSMEEAILDGIRACRAVIGSSA